MEKEFNIPRAFLALETILIHRRQNNLFQRF